MPENTDDGSPIIRPPTFDRTAFRLLLVAVVVGGLTIAIVMLWREFSWLMALSSGAGVAVLIFFSGRAIRVLRFEYLRPPFEREE
ncbi:MAG: hypothetical protein F4Z19_03905 [Holophagales bacterium]|nr:hypothetical protein [Holophagales bacterium]